MRTEQTQRAETLGDPLDVKQHHWNTLAKENHQLIPGGLRHRHKTLLPRTAK